MRYLLPIIAAIFLAMPAYAGFEGGTHPEKGGFAGPGAVGGECTVQQAKSMPDDTYVTLTGSIVSRVGDDDYIFRDHTGEIKVDIDHKYFRGQRVTPENTVRITGEIDKDFARAVEIDVKNLEILK